MIKLFEQFKKSLKVFKGINRTKTNFTYGGVNDDGIGDFYTDNIIMAKWFAGLTDYDVDLEKYVDIENDGEVITKTIYLENPYIIQSDDEDEDSIQVYFNEIRESGGVSEYRDSLIEKGYDGIIALDCTTNYYDYPNTYSVYIVF